MDNFKEGDITSLVDERLTHIAFIMDGNGRWATSRGKKRELGHKEGAKVFEDISTYCGDIGIRCVTVYAFSTENWKRPIEEVTAIMKLLELYFVKAFDLMKKKNVQIHFVGDLSPFSDKFKKTMKKIEEDSKDNYRILNICLNYGGRDEIVHAANACIEEGDTYITEKDLEKHLYTSHCPPPDLIVRTGGEFRLSNFLMWQSAYSELYFIDKYWPDLTHDDVDEAVRNFYNRIRRFGGI